MKKAMRQRGLALYAFCALAFLYLPLLILIVFSFNAMNAYSCSVAAMSFVDAIQYKRNKQPYLFYFRCNNLSYYFNAR